MILTRLLRDQKQELEEEIGNKKILEREAGMYFKNILGSKLIKVTSGVRRCGKSVFTYVLLKNKNFAYMNFDDDRLPDFDANLHYDACGFCVSNSKFHIGLTMSISWDFNPQPAMCPIILVADGLDFPEDIRNADFLVVPG